MNLSIIDIEESMPGKIVHNDFFGEPEVRLKNKMFSGTKERRHVERDEYASEYFASAAERLFARLGINARDDVDMILTNVSVPDEAFTGCGAVVNKKLKGNSKWIFDIHNTGCVSFLFLMEMANAYMVAHGVRHALICLGQTAGGRVFGQEDTRQFAQAAIPGDGFAVVYVTNSQERPLLAMELKNHPSNAEDMYTDCNGKKWWEARECSGKIDFDEDRAVTIITRGNRTVPAMIHQACQQYGIKTTDIDYLITNQPNTNFLRNWREAVLIPKEKHLDTFEKYANLFGSGIPVTLAEALKAKTIKKGDMLCLAGFSHACDFSGAALVRW